MQAVLPKCGGARAYAHAADLELINKGEAERPGTSVTPGIKNR